ncbi:MAG TPA: nucleotidyltransferase family protein [Acidobacteriota bacterium]|nr:nucleotidyltransferase family protein [Acidobacteriota bacterium]
MALNWTDAPRVWGILLAAGRSARFGDAPKQLARFGGTPLVRLAALACLDSLLCETVLVTGYLAPEIRRAVQDLPLKTTENPDYGEGKSSSIRAGLRALPESCDGALFVPCDQPFLTAAVIDGIIEAYDRAKASGLQPVVIPCHRGRKGAPALFDRTYFPELSNLNGDEGGRQLMELHPARIIQVELESAKPLLDVDCPEELLRYRKLSS